MEGEAEAAAQVEAEAVEEAGVEVSSAIFGRARAHALKTARAHASPRRPHHA